MPHVRHDVELVPGCPECDALAPDLAALTASLASLRGGTQAGHRDFRLTPDDAARLRRGRGLRAWLRPLAGAGFAFARPLGSALTVVALVGLVATSLPASLGDGGGAEMFVEATDMRDGQSVVPAANPDATEDAASGAATPKAGSSGGPAATRLTALGRTAEPKGAPPIDSGTPPAATTNAVFLASLVLLPIGLLLFLGRGVAQRLIGAAREP